VNFSVQVLNAHQIARFSGLLSERKIRKCDKTLTVASANKHLRNVRAGLRWAESAGLISVAPKFSMVKRLRRVFATRWAPRVPATILMQLIRHSDIKTTMQFYVGREVESVSKLLKCVFAFRTDTITDTKADETRNGRRKELKSPISK